MESNLHDAEGRCLTDPCPEDPKRNRQDTCDYNELCEICGARTIHVRRIEKIIRKEVGVDD